MVTKRAPDPKKIIFAQRLFAGDTGADAARKAGYKGTRVTLRSRAAHLREHPVVQAELLRLAEQTSKKAVADRNEVLDLLSRMIRFNPVELIREDGTINLEQARSAGLLNLVESLDVVEEVNKDGILTRRVKVRFPDKLGAIDRAARFLDWFHPEKQEVTHHMALQDQLNALTDDEYRDLVEELKRDGTLPESGGDPSAPEASKPAPV